MISLMYGIQYHTLEGPVKITTYIDENLLKKAFRALGARSKREVLESGLRTLLAEIERGKFVRDFDHLRLRLTPLQLDRARR